MTGGFGRLPACIIFANDVIQRIESFRSRWLGKMSKETDDLSADSIKAISDLKAYAESQFNAGKEAGIQQAKDRFIARMFDTYPANFSGGGSYD